MKFLSNVCFLLVGCTRPILSMFLIYIAYLVIGSAIFVNLETEEETKTRSESLELFQKSKGMVDILRTNYSDNEIYYTFLVEHEDLKEKPKPITLGWRQMFGDKVFFAFILITTVGYGNVAPKSKLGQVVCVLYTMFGLPIHVVMMRLLSFKFRGGMREVFTISQSLFPGFKWPLFIVGFFFFLFWVTIFIFIPAEVFTRSENWQFSRGVYFSFVSLTTIGLGDYVAGVSSEHIEHKFYPVAIFLMLLWMFVGLGFVSMALNMFSYVMGIFTLDKLDCKCKQRAEGRKKLKRLLELLTELNWQLVKSKPDNFHDWEEIENFKTFISEQPQDVTLTMLKRMFDISIDLKEKCYDQLSLLQETTIPMTPIIERAKNNMPDVLSTQSMNVTFSQQQVPEDAQQSSVKKKAKVGKGNKSLTTLIDQKKEAAKSEDEALSKDLTSVIDDLVTNTAKSSTRNLNSKGTIQDESKGRVLLSKADANLERKVTGDDSKADDESATGNNEVGEEMENMDDAEEM